MSSPEPSLGQLPEPLLFGDESSVAELLLESLPQATSKAAMENGIINFLSIFGPFILSIGNQVINPSRNERRAHE